LKVVEIELLQQDGGNSQDGALAASLQNFNIKLFII
jgi:hypothetical protein